MTIGTKIAQLAAAAAILGTTAFATRPRPRRRTES
jgi:hypothetical protein